MFYSMTITLTSEKSSTLPETVLKIGVSDDCIAVVTHCQDESHTQIFFRTNVEKLREKLS